VRPVSTVVRNFSSLVDLRLSNDRATVEISPVSYRTTSRHHAEGQANVYEMFYASAEVRSQRPLYEMRPE
jgi:hypothetical protein